MRWFTRLETSMVVAALFLMAVAFSLILGGWPK